MEPDLPPIPDALPEIPPLPSLADALAPSLELIAASQERVADLLRLKERVKMLEAAHRQALADYRADADRMVDAVQRANDNAQRARNEADVLARALRELVDTLPLAPLVEMTQAQRMRHQTAVRHAREVLALWGRK